MLYFNLKMYTRVRLSLCINSDYIACVFVCVCPALQAGSVDDLRSFKSRRQPTRRSARSGTIKGPIDPKG